MSEAPIILLAEDEPNDVFLVQRALLEARIANRLIVVNDGQKALGYFAGEGRYANREQYPLPQLVLLDLDMPVVNGFDVLTRLRQHPAFTDLPVVVFTASSRSPDVSRAYRLGANSFLVKPSELRQLSDALKEIVHCFVEKPFDGADLPTVDLRHGCGSEAVSA